MKIFAQIIAKYGYDKSFWGIFLLRIVFALSILHWPVFGWIMSAVFDVVDGHIFIYKCKLSPVEYHVWDKLLDITSFFSMLIVAWQLNLFPVFLTILLGYRLIGQIIFWKTLDDKILLFFPNIFETLWLYALGRLLWFSQASYLSLVSIVWFIFLMLVKLCQEWGLHYFGKKGLFKWGRDLLRPIMPWLAK